MLKYLQFRPDKKESWHLYEEEQVDKLGKRPAFLSVLSVDQDVDELEDSFGVVKYSGPMYFDIDNKDDLDAAIASAKELIEKLEALGIDESYIHCWLSGGKGFHITVPGKIFGLKRPLKHLPRIYGEIAKELHVEHLDMGVYSEGKGRLWRCEHVPRPGSGTYKVSTTVDEIQDMDAEMYEALVANDRVSAPLAQPPGNLEVPQAINVFKKARKSANAIVKALSSAKVVPSEDLRKLEYTPGCVKKLIEDGDCAESNWNQAAMQVGAWVAARYTRKEKEEYERDVVEPFVCNVSSSSRPTEKERRKHVNEQISRAFQGRTKFFVGPLIRTIGTPCSNCPVCREDIGFSEEEGSVEGFGDELFDESSKIMETSSGYVKRSDNGSRVLTSFIFSPEKEVRNLEEVGEDGELSETSRVALIGTLYAKGGRKQHDFEIPETAWASKKELITLVNGNSVAAYYGTDADLQYLYTAIIGFSDRRHDGELPIMTQTKICGIYLERRGKKVLTHYIEADTSIMPSPGAKGVTTSRFRYNGAKSQSPSLIDEAYPTPGDTELKETLWNLFRVNTPVAVAKMVGWFCACHMREHIHEEIPQFPLLNIWGNASAGKTMSAFLMAHLNGMDYQNKAEPLNMENATIHPLLKYLTSSTTVPRLVEEVNESMMNRSNYMRTLGLFKAAWNRSTAPRGRIGSAGIDNNRVSSPIVYVSEQRTTKPAMRNRTIEVMLTADGRETGNRSDHFEKASDGRHSLFRAAKAMLQLVLGETPKDIINRVRAEAPNIPNPRMDARPKFSAQVALAGLKLFEDAMRNCGVDISEDIKMLRDAMIKDMDDNSVKQEIEKRTSEVDRVLMAWDQMAGDPTDSTGLRHDEHYTRIGNKLKLNIQASMTRYRRWCRGIGEPPAISDAGQLAELMEGERYFERIEQTDDERAAPLHVINLDRLRANGQTLYNFTDSQ